MFPKKGKGPTTKQFDEDEWIRSLTEAQEVTTDIPEGSVTYDQQDVDPKKVRSIQMGGFLRKYVSRRLLALSEEEIAALTTSMRQIGVGTPGGAEIFQQTRRDETTRIQSGTQPCASSFERCRSSTMSGRQVQSLDRWPESKSTSKTALG